MLTSLCTTHTLSPSLRSPRDPVAVSLSVSEWAPFAQQAAAWHPRPALQEDTAVAINTHSQIAQARAGRGGPPFPQSWRLNMPKWQPITPANLDVLHTTPMAPLHAPYQRASQLDGTGA